ncbi:MAG: 6-phosphogluconolactonase [Verrucomicrobiales bacterium]
MDLSVFPTRSDADAAASERLADWLMTPGVRNVMLAAGNTPLELYRLIGANQLPLSHLHLFALDEYVGVPVDEPRNCANVIRRTTVEPWGIPMAQYHTVSSNEAEALGSVGAHERLIRESGGVDVLVLGLGQNGHLGFNEPGSTEDSEARVLDLDSISIEANRLWFGGDHAPARGATVGMKTILEARRIIVLAYGAHKREAVAAMRHGPRTPRCPASLLQGHSGVHLFLDAEAASGQTEHRP